MQILEIWLTMVNNLSLFYLIQKYCEYIRYKKKKRIQDVYVYKNNKFTLCWYKHLWHLLIKKKKRERENYIKSSFSEFQSAKFIPYVTGYKNGSVAVLLKKSARVQDSSLALSATCCDLVQCTIWKLHFSSAFLIPNAPH